MIIVQFKTKGLQLRSFCWPGQISTHSCPRVKPPKVKKFAFLAFEAGGFHMFVDTWNIFWVFAEHRGWESSKEETKRCPVGIFVIILVFFYRKRWRKMAWDNVYNSFGLFAHAHLSTECHFLKTYLTIASKDVFSLYSQPEQHPISPWDHFV